MHNKRDLILTIGTQVEQKCHTCLNIYSISVLRSVNKYMYNQIYIINKPYSSINANINHKKTEGQLNNGTAVGLERGSFLEHQFKHISLLNMNLQMKTGNVTLGMQVKQRAYHEYKIIQYNYKHASIQYTSTCIMYMSCIWWIGNVTMGM